MSITAKNCGAFTIMVMLCSPLALADEAEPTQLFATAAVAFDAGNFARAAELLEQLAPLQPACGECAHLLGKAYGRMAEQAPWTRAIELAKKTRLALENAVDLDPSNAPALEDLIRYYRKAPGFLGGDDAKAAQLEQRLYRLRAESTS
ncbi:MAG: hypothetical protein ACU85U_17425 [Gammaproteobacteria bacterium]|jgi:hypothetical protein